MGLRSLFRRKKADDAKEPPAGEASPAGPAVVDLTQVDLTQEAGDPLTVVTSNSLRPAPWAPASWHPGQEGAE
jgi:hypothetical protein